MVIADRNVGATARRVSGAFQKHIERSELIFWGETSWGEGGREAGKRAWRCPPPPALRLALELEGRRGGRGASAGLAASEAGGPRLRGWPMRAARTRLSAGLPTDVRTAKRMGLARRGTLELGRASSQRDSPHPNSTLLTLSLRGWRDGCGWGAGSRTVRLGPGSILRLR